jgi:hypothetical protein
MRFSTGSGLSRVLAIAFLALLAVVVWQMKDRKAVQVNSYKDCVDAGYPVQESFPEVCRAPDGRSFTNPDQKAPELPR